MEKADYHKLIESKELSGRTQIRRYILSHNLLEYKCQDCGIESEWNQKPLILELHHKDGNNENNNLENLMFLCPNCHSQTESYCRSSAKDNSPHAWNPELFLEYYLQGKSIRQALISSGGGESGYFYNKAQDLFKEKGIDPNKKDVNYCCDCKIIIGKDSKRCKQCSAKFSRLVERPNQEELLKEIAESSFCAVGRKYGVSDNAIRRWCKAYGLPTHKDDIVKYYKTLAKK